MTSIVVQVWLQTDKAAYLLRLYFYSKLHDRLSTLPFLSQIEKKWLAFQLIHAVEQSHSKGVCHDDIKCENVLVTSWNWLYLADFASFKPTYISDDDPSDFSFFFDTGGRRRCYLAPERFYGHGGEAQVAADAPLQPSMDIFSLGCVLAELFLEGQPLFELSQLLAYRRAQYDPMHALEKVVKTQENFERIHDIIISGSKIEQIQGSAIVSEHSELSGKKGVGGQITNSPREYAKSTSVVKKNIPGDHQQIAGDLNFLLKEVEQRNSHTGTKAKQYTDHFPFPSRDLPDKYDAMPLRRKRRAAPAAKQQLPEPPGADTPLQERIRWLNDQELERRTAAIKAIQAAETESVLSRLRLVQSYICKEQQETRALQFFQENLPNLSVIWNEKHNELELKWKDWDSRIFGDQRDDKILRASIASLPTIGGLQFSGDSVQKNFIESTGFDFNDFAWSELPEGQMAGSADSLQTPGAVSNRLSFGMTPKTVRLPKNGEMLLSVHGSPLGVYKEDNLAAIHESGNGSGDAAS